MKKRIISLAILCALVLSQFACGTQDEVQSETTASDTTADTTVAAETEVSDDLPDKKFDGNTFTTITADYIEADYIAEEANGDVINDAVYKRNQAVMERFDVKLETVTDNYSNVNTLVQQSVMAGDDEYQMVSNHVVRLSGLATTDILMNWYDVPYINFEKPWWSNSTVEDLTYNGVAILAVGDYALSALSRTYCVFYDKKAADNYHFDNLYDIVYDGKWTMDYMANLCKGIYQDLNGNSQRDEYDYYGLTTSMGSEANAFLWSCGNKIFTKQKDGTLEYTYNNERTIDIFEKLFKFCYENEGVNTDRPQYTQENIWLAAPYAFKDDLTAMIPGTLSMSVEYFRERENEYGILPYPKFDEAQDGYYTMVDGGHAALAIPKSVQDLEFVGIITEALNAETHKIVFPAYYEIALKVKYSHDDESVKMLDMIVENRIFDFGYVYDNWKGVSFIYQRLLRDEKSMDFASYYAKNSSAAEDYYDGVIEYFDKLANE